MDKINTLAAEKFLSALDSTTQVFVFQTFSDKKTKGEKDPLARALIGTFEQHKQTLIDLNEKGGGVFVQVNGGGARGKAHITGIRALFVDTDGADVRNIMRSMRRPQFVSESSPGKYHLYWKVSDGQLDLFSLHQSLLAKKFDCDPSVKNLDRVLRVPGFVNYKYDVPHLVTCAGIGEGVPSYTTNQVMEPLSPKVSAADSHPVVDTDSGSSFTLPAVLPPGDRTLHLVSYAGQLAGRGLDEPVIRAEVRRVMLERCPPGAEPIDDATLEQEIFPAIGKFLIPDMVQYKPGMSQEVTTQAGADGQVGSFIDGAPRSFEPSATAAPAKLKTFPLTDLGNAQCLIYHNQGTVQYVYEERRWLYWTKDVSGKASCKWSWDITGDIYRRIWALLPVVKAQIAQRTLGNDKEYEAQIKKLTRLQSSAGVRGCLDLAPQCPGVTIPIERLDSDPWVLGVANGVVNLKDGTFREMRPDDYITVCSPVSMPTGAEGGMYHALEQAAGSGCPTWERFLLEVMDDNYEMVSFLQRAVGYTLTGVTTEQSFFVMYGTGANGKSTFINILSALLGKLSTTTSVAAFTGDKPSSEDSYRFAKFRGTRGLFMAEARESVRLREELIKVATGGDELEGRVPYGQFFTYTPQFKPWMSTNHKPTIYGTDHAIWRRVKLIPFEVCIPDEEQDHQLEDKLKAEIPGILAWAIQGCLEWQKVGLKPPQVVLDATQAYRDESDEILRFMDDNCTVTPGCEDVEVAAGALYHCYSNWKKDRNEKPMTQTMFGRKMLERGAMRKRKTDGMYYTGVTLNGIGSPRM